MVKENKNVEIQEQTTDEQVAESYYLENEAWSDISVAKSYGPARCFATCSSCSMVYGAGSYTKPCPRCGARSIQSNDEGSSSNNSTRQVNHDPNARYYCVVSNCPNGVSSQCGYCSSHRKTCEESHCNATIPYNQTYCRPCQERQCSHCRLPHLSGQEYCAEHMQKCS